MCERRMSQIFFEMEEFEHPKKIPCYIGQTVPWTIYSAEPNISSVGGLMGDILQALSDSLDFDYILMEVPDNQFGFPIGNGSWTGMIGMVHNEEVEFALGPFSTSIERESVVDFSIPVYHSNIALLTTRPRIEYDMEGLLRPFTLEVWLCILFSVAVISFALAVAEMIEANLHGCATKRVPTKSVMLSIKALAQETSEWLPKRSSGRFLAAIWLLASLVFLSSFSGILTAMLTVPKVAIPIDSLEDLVYQTKVTWKMLPGTFLLNYFKESPYDVHQKAYQGLSGTVPTAWGSRQDVLEGKYALITEETQIKQIIGWDYSTSGRCNLYMARKYVYSNNLYSIAFQTNSSYLPRANKLITSLSESGLIQYWYQRYLANTTLCLRPPTSDRAVDEITALNVKVFSSSFILITGGHALAFFMFVWERIQGSYKNLSYPISQ